MNGDGFKSGAINIAACCSGDNSPGSPGDTARQWLADEFGGTIAYSSFTQTLLAWDDDGDGILNGNDVKGSVLGAPTVTDLNGTLVQKRWEFTVTRPGSGVEKIGGGSAVDANIYR